FIAQEKGLEFECTVASQVPKYLIGNPYRLNQILINLCSNAIMHTQKGEVNLTVSIDANKSDKLHFAVTDTGVGIAKDDLENIFGNYDQARTNAISNRGTGLGLAISKELVELQNGKIGVKSEIGKGSEFYFTLPLQTAPSEIGEKLKIETELDASPLKGLRVLVGEDSPFNQIVIKDTLNHLIEDVTVTTAENGLIVIEALKEDDYDLILMDINMAEMNGFECAKQIRSAVDSPKSQIPIIALSASVYGRKKQSIFDAGMNDFIPKPFTREELIGTIKKHVLNA
ncbi:MAG: response regulator, partial [Bacteroidetes bacterium]|nr:response regulator [Bacteroidota bacterium]